MSDSQTKLKTSKRRHRTTVASKRQYHIAKQYGQNPDPNSLHRFAKHHAMDCGNPDCCLCGNPRNNKTFKAKEKLTTQERRFFQAVEHNKHTPGTGYLPDITDED